MDTLAFMGASTSIIEDDDDQAMVSWPSLKKLAMEIYLQTSPLHKKLPAAHTTNVEFVNLLLQYGHTDEERFDTLRQPIVDAIKAALKDDSSDVWCSLQAIARMGTGRAYARGVWNTEDAYISGALLARILDEQKNCTQDQQQKIMVEAFATALREIEGNPGEVIFENGTFNFIMPFDGMPATHVSLYELKEHYVQCAGWTVAPLYTQADDAFFDIATSVNFPDDTRGHWIALDDIAERFFGLCHQTAEHISNEPEVAGFADKEDIDTIEKLENIVNSFSPDNPAYHLYDNAERMWLLFLANLAPEATNGNNQGPDIVAKVGMLTPITLDSRQTYGHQLDFHLILQSTPKTHCKKSVAIRSLENMTAALDRINISDWDTALLHYLALAIADTKQVPRFEHVEQRYTLETVDVIEQPDINKIFVAKPGQILTAITTRPPKKVRADLASDGSALSL